MGEKFGSRAKLPTPTFDTHDGDTALSARSYVREISTSKADAFPITPRPASVRPIAASAAAKASQPPPPPAGRKASIPPPAPMARSVSVPPASRLPQMPMAKHKEPTMELTLDDAVVTSADVDISQLGTADDDPGSLHAERTEAAAFEASFEHGEDEETAIHPGGFDTRPATGAFTAEPTAFDNDDSVGIPRAGWIVQAERLALGLKSVVSSAVGHVRSAGGGGATGMAARIRARAGEIDIADLSSELWKATAFGLRLASTVLRIAADRLDAITDNAK
jgi:hypothetical protein